MQNKIDREQIRDFNKSKTQSFTYIFNRINDKKQTRAKEIKENILGFFVVVLYAFLFWVALLLFA